MTIEIGYLHIKSVLSIKTEELSEKYKDINIDVK